MTGYATRRLSTYAVTGMLLLAAGVQVYACPCAMWRSYTALLPEEIAASAADGCCASAPPASEHSAAEACCSLGAACCCEFPGRTGLEPALLTGSTRDAVPAPALSSALLPRCWIASEADAAIPAAAAPAPKLANSPSLAVLHCAFLC